MSIRITAMTTNTVTVIPTAKPTPVLLLVVVLLVVIDSVTDMSKQIQT